MKTLKNLSKRSLAVLLALVMCVGMLNLTAFAAGTPQIRRPANGEYDVEKADLEMSYTLYVGDTKTYYYCPVDYTTCPRCGQIIMTVIPDYYYVDGIYTGVDVWGNGISNWAMLCGRTPRPTPSK